MKTILPIEGLSTEEKLRAMEELWHDLSQQDRDIPVPAWHLDVLKERQKKVASGEESFIPWEEAKQTLRNKRK